MSDPAGEATAPPLDDVPLAPALAYARSIDYAPGSNLKGRLAGATWTWLLQTPVLDGAAIFGDAPAAARAAALGSPRTIVYDGPAEALRAALVPHGISVPVTYAVRPARGELRSAVPIDDPIATDWLSRRGLLGPAVVVTGTGGGHVGRLWRRLRARAPWPRPTERAIALLGPDAPGPGVPRYLRAMATSAGMDLAGWRFALAAPGDYNTQKLLLWLWPSDAEDPAIVVKATRDAVATPRLENERLALERLAALGEMSAGRTPRVRFAGRLAERALVGEEVLDGRSLRVLGPLAVTDGRVQDALTWLADLAVRTRRPVDPAAAADALADLARRWAASTAPSPAMAARIRSDVAVVGASACPLPVVYQHGDPGTWNLFAGADGRIRFLDWENFDPGGLPLWDVLYLLRAVVADGVGKRPTDGLGRGRRAGRIAARFVRALRSDPAVIGAVERYCGRVGLEPDLVGPIARLGWMHQALKEATRLRAGEGGRAPSQATLRASIDL